MELTGRLTANAIVSTLKDERQVVHFTLAINDYYKPKGSSEAKQFTQFVKCSYWRSTAVAQRLQKGTVVEISGRPFTSAYVSTDGEARANLNAHCNSIKVHGSGAAKKKSISEPELVAASPLNEQVISLNTTIPEDDIPF